MEQQNRHCVLSRVNKAENGRQSKRGNCGGQIMEDFPENYFSTLIRLENIIEFWEEKWCDLTYALMRLSRVRLTQGNHITNSDGRHGGGLCHRHDDDDSCSMSTVQKKQ